MLAVPLVIVVFVVMAFLKRRGALTLGRAVALGAIAMFGILFVNALSIGTSPGWAAGSATLFTIIGTAIMYVVMKIAGMDEA